MCRVKQQCLSLDSASGRLWDLDLGHFALLLHEEFLRTSTQTLSNGEQNMKNNEIRTRESTSHLVCVDGSTQHHEYQISGSGLFSISVLLCLNKVCLEIELLPTNYRPFFGPESA